MAFCSLVQFQWLKKNCVRVLLCFLSFWLLVHDSRATEAFDALTAAKLPVEWPFSLGAKSVGSIQATPGGVVLSAEGRMHALLKRDNNVVGSDTVPLAASVQIKTQPGCEGPTQPGLYLFWDNANWLSMRQNGENVVFCAGTIAGVYKEWHAAELLRESLGPDGKPWGKEVYLRILLVSHNAAFFVSASGSNWTKIGEFGARPGPEGKAPPKIILGRGWCGDTDAKPELCNDFRPDGNKRLFKTILCNFKVSDGFAGLPELPALVKQDTWEQTCAGIELSTGAEQTNVPRAWTFLGPLPEQGFAGRKDLAPDLRDDWSAGLKDPNGQIIKLSTWNRPDEDAADCHVDLSDLMASAAHALSWGRTEITWPVDGEALLWFDSAEPITLFVNNLPVYFDNADQNISHAIKDRHCVDIALKKGRNVIKVKSHQNKGGEWGFYLRLERTDPAYRIALLSKLLELFPEPCGHADQARLEIARCYRQQGNFQAALSAFDKAILYFSADDEKRLQAFNSKINILAFLRDYTAGAKADDDYLAKYPHGPGTVRAMCESLRANVLGGHLDLARAHLKNWSAAATTSDTVVFYRAVAGALNESGHEDEGYDVLDELSAVDSVENSERARAAIESAVCRWNLDRLRQGRGQKPDMAKLTRCCESERKALALLPGAQNPMVKWLAQEAESNLKGQKIERAFGGYWGAVLLAVCAANRDADYYLAFSKAYPIVIPAKDLEGHEIVNANQFKDLLAKILPVQMGEPAWLGKWYSINFSLEGDDARKTFGPETNADLNAAFDGKKWIEIPVESNCDQGIDLAPWGGKARQVAYVARDFNALDDGAILLQISACSAWFAWLDGKPAGENISAEGYKLERDRVPLQLRKGKHRLLLKLEAPAQGPYAFRARLSNEPQLAIQLLVQALAQRNCATDKIDGQASFPASIWDRRNDLDALRNIAHGKTNIQTTLAISDAISQVLGIEPEMYLWNTLAMCDQLKESGDQAQADTILEGMLSRAATGNREALDYTRQNWEMVKKLAMGLASEGRMDDADTVLRDACNLWPEPLDQYLNALVMRGTLRRDVGQSQAALPFFERASRELPALWKASPAAVTGLEWARNFRPERLVFETSHEAQAALEAVRRQVGAGSVEDIERAMRNISALAEQTNGQQNSSGGGGTLSRVSESPFSSRYVGIREYIRALLASLPEATRDIYRKVTAASADEKLKRAIQSNQPSILEALASEFYFTPAAQWARNQAGNIYLDRGQYAQAANVFQLLLREPSLPGGPARAVVLGKLIRALTLDEQLSAARATIDQLKTRSGEEQVRYGGANIQGKTLAETLTRQLTVHAPTAPTATAASTPPTTTFMDNLCRTGKTSVPPSSGAVAPVPGAVMWARPLIPSPLLEGTRGFLDADPFVHLPPYPVVADGKVYMSGLESLRALDLATGKTLWSRTWGAGGPLLRAPFNGFPVSCPTLSGGRIYMRALESRISSLRCFDAATGKLQWSTETIPELRSAVWLTDPALSYGLAFAVFLEPGEMSTHGLAAIDAASGDLRWKTTLVTGSTAVKINEDYVLSSVHAGPPAVDGGEIYIATGMSSAAAVNAFSGEVKWIASYPKISFGDLRAGRTWMFDTRLRTYKMFASGPLSPMLCDDVLIIAPHDGSGVMAFDRQSGAILWHKEMLGCRFLAGLADGNVLVCDDTISAVNAVTGNVAWEYTPRGQHLYGQPTLSGGVLYLPLEKELQRLDAKSGRLIGSTAWDTRVGPLANLTITSEQVLGVGSGVVAAMGTGVAVTRLPLYEAKEFEAAGKLEEAAASYALFLSSHDTDEALAALSARINILEKLGKRDEARGDLKTFEQDAPSLLSSANGLWQIKKEVLVAALRKRLGEAVEERPATNRSLDGVLAYAWQLPGENPRIINPIEGDGAPDRFFALIGNEIHCLRIGDGCETLWRSYVGPGLSQISVGDGALAALSDQRIIVLDRATGELLSDVKLPTRMPVRKKRFQADKFSQVATGGGEVIAAAGHELCAWDFRTGKDLWWRSLGDGMLVPNGLIVLNDKVVDIYSVKNELFLGIFDLKTGDTLKSLDLGKGTDVASLNFSPDRHHLVYRTHSSLGCIDLLEVKKLWEIGAPQNHTPGLIAGGFYQHIFELSVDTDYIRFAGQKNGKPYTQWFNLLNGKEVTPLQGVWFAHKVKDEYVTFSEDWMRSVCRRRIHDNTDERVWSCMLPVSTYNHFFQYACVAGDRLHIVYFRNQENHDQFLLRTLSWDTGLVIGEQILPGTPIRSENNDIAASFVERAGVLMYTAREGVFAVGSRGETVAKSAANLRAELSDAATSAPRARDARRALLSLEPTVALALIAPANHHVDGDMSEWAHTDPIVLEGPLNYVPLADDQKWNGPSDLSARVYTGWNKDGLAIAIDVSDDILVPPAPGRELTSGDSVRVIVASHAEAGAVLDINEDVVVSMALVNGRTVLNQEFGASDDPGCVAQGHAMRAPNGRGYRYELLFPWPLIRKDANNRPGGQLDMRLGIAVYDDDGAGVKGALELGAGITAPNYAPQWLSQLTLLDISSEKIERYRKVIELVPASSEAFKFLEMILAVKRGPAADSERVAEIESFVKAHPDCGNTLKVIELLRPIFGRMGETNPGARIDKLAAEAKLPARLQQAISGTSFKIWVLPDAQNPPQMIMLQFSPTGDWNVAVRAYWGTSCVDWGQAGTRQRLCMGPLPKAGEWTQLSVSPYELGIENCDIRIFALTTFGGLTHFDRMSVTVGGKENVLIDDALPPKTRVEINAFKFVDKPRHDGAKGWTADAGNAKDGLRHTLLSFEDGKPFLSFVDASIPKPVPPDPARTRDLYRQVEQLIPDTPEGLEFLRHVMELQGSDDKIKSAKCIEEALLFLKANPSTANCIEILRMFMYSLYARAGETHVLEKCEQTIQDYKMSRDVRLAFFKEFSPAWSEWQVLGPFAGSGEHRGLEIVMNPERGVDLTWKAAGAGQDIGWKKISNKLDAKKQPNPEQFVDLRRHLQIPKSLEQHGPCFGYAYAKFNVPSKRRALMLFGAQDMLSIWLNGKRVVSELESWPEKDKDAREIQLRSGENEILIKVGAQKDQRLGFVFRLADLDGKPFPDVSNE